MAHLLQLNDSMLKQKITAAIAIAVALFASSCGSTTHDNDEQKRQEKALQAHKDSLALKIGVTPTIDCLPLFVAEQTGIFESLEHVIDEFFSLFNVHRIKEFKQALFNQQ